MVTEERVRGRQPHRQVEEARLRKGEQARSNLIFDELNDRILLALLPSMRANERDEFQRHLHLSGS